jgi:tripartite-type tricarboxylate transporter receptor subunit TctC
MHPDIARTGRRLLLAAPLMLAARLAGAEGFPDRPLRLVVAYAPGGAADLMARGMAQHMQARLSVPVAVENRSGGTGAIGAQAVAQAPADGHTLLFASGTEISVQPLVQKGLTYDVDRDFVPITLCGITPIVLAVHATLPAADLPGLLALAGRRPLSFSSSGSGTINHLTGELFAAKSGILLLHVPYRGTGQAVMDAASGQVDMIFAGLPAILPLVRSGQLRILAVSTARRSAAAPDVPTLAELGLPGFDMSNWFGLMAPTGTPSAALVRLGDAARAATATPEVRGLFTRLGGEALGSSAAEYRSFIHAERARLGEAVAAAGLAPG